MDMNSTHHSTPDQTQDPVYDTIAAFAAGLVEQGVTDVVISPGSRSTPLAVTFHAQPGLRTWIQLDERSAGFFALGQAKATGRPSVLVCTSGTAAANYLPAVIEAHHSGVPLIICTADRPPELRGWGAGQTIDQVGIYGDTTRWAVDLPVAGTPAWSPAQARIAAHRAADAATAVDAGPVHLNWPLREPLEPVGPVPIVAAEPVDHGPRGSHASSPVDLVNRVDIDGPVVAGGTRATRATRGVVVVGPDAGVGLEGQSAVVEAALMLGARNGWPVIGEPISGVRRAGPGTGAGKRAGALRIAHADHLLRVDEIAEELAPELVVRVGGSPTTKPVRLWLERHRPEVVLIDPARKWNDASFTVTHHVTDDPIEVLRNLSLTGEGVADRSWCDRWAELDLAAAAAVGEELALGPLLSGEVVRVLADCVPAGTLVMTSNSMPVRDLDSFVPLDGPEIDFVGNRGASGIDGITSTALGLASQHDAPVVLFIGDLALLHDLGALVGAARSGLHLTIVCVDNDGGGIFSMLPIAARDDLDANDFETLFRTPHGLDLRGFDGIGGVRVAEVTSAKELREGLVRSTAPTAASEPSEPGVDLLLIPVDRDADLAQRRTITAAVRAAVT